MFTFSIPLNFNENYVELKGLQIHRETFNLAQAGYRSFRTASIQILAGKDIQVKIFSGNIILPRWKADPDKGWLATETNPSNQTLLTEYQNFTVQGGKNFFTKFDVSSDPCSYYMIEVNNPTANVTDTTPFCLRLCFN